MRANNIPKGGFPFIKFHYSFLFSAQNSPRDGNSLTFFYFLVSFVGIRKNPCCIEILSFTKVKKKITGSAADHLLSGEIPMKPAVVVLRSTSSSMLRLVPPSVAIHTHPSPYIRCCRDGRKRKQIHDKRKAKSNIAKPLYNLCQYWRQI